MDYRVETIEKNGKIAVASSVVYSYPAHIHTYSEMILYEPFDGMVIVNDRHIPANAGCAVLVVPSDLHRVVVRESRKAKFIKIAFQSQLTEHSVVIAPMDNNAFLAAVFAEIQNSSQSERYIQLLTQTAEHILLQEGIEIPPLQNQQQKGLAVQAVEILKKQAYPPITLQSVANRLFVSAPYLSKVFKQTVGIGFNAYLNELRLEQAARLLRNTDKSITDVCTESGFQNLSHFIRSFHKKYGMTPTAFRSKHLAD